MSQVFVDLTISADEYLKLYQGKTTIVNATARDGRKVHFPANILVPFVTREGIHGSFCINYDANNRFQHIQRL